MTASKGMVDVGNAIELAQPVQELQRTQLVLVTEISSIEHQLTTEKEVTEDTTRWRASADFALRKRKERLARIQSVLATRVQEELGAAFIAAAKAQLAPEVFQAVMDAARTPVA